MINISDRDQITQQNLGERRKSNHQLIIGLYVCIMNFIDYYRSQIGTHGRGNYIIEAPEGYGKSTILEKLYNDCKSDLEQGYGKTIPVFIRMADINVKPLEYINSLGVIFGLLQEQYFNANSSKATISQIKGMIKQATGYRFLFLLDGLNEVVNREVTEEGLRVLDVLENELKSQSDLWFIDYQNVDIVITTRNKAVISENFYERQQNNTHRFFKIVHLKKLRTDQEDNMEMTEVLSTPLLAVMYESIAKEKKNRNMTKYQLLSCYYELDTVLNNNKRLKDYRDERVALVLNQILPIVALKVEVAMLHFINKDDAGKEFREMQKKGLREIVNETLAEQEIPADISIVLQTISMLNVVNEKLNFSHDMIREFWAVRGFCWCTRYKDYVLYSKQVKALIEYIIKYTERKDYYEPIRQTLHIGLMETMIGSQDGEPINDKFEKVLKGLFQDDYKYILFRVVYNYCSILDDEVQRNAAAEYAWKAYDYLRENPEIEETYLKQEKIYELSGIYNSLGYCVNNSIIDGRSGDNVIFLLNKAKELAESIRFNGLPDSKIMRIKVLLGKIYNNLGACYYGKYYKDYRKALEWHNMARNYRMDNGIDLCASYRVIASDYFMLHEYQKSYEEFKEFMRYISGGNRGKISELKEELSKLMKDYRYSGEIIIILLNAIGSECKLIFSKYVSEDMRDKLFYEVQKEMPYQLDFCVEHINRGSRIRAIDWIQKIQDKIEGIRNVLPYLDQETCRNIEMIFEKYNGVKSSL